MKSVLVVDDAELFRKILCRALEADGVRAIPAANGQQALERVRLYRPQLVLLDLVMDGMDGFEVLRALRLDKQTAALPVIVLSATIDETVTQRALALGADRMLFKTRFAIGELRELVREFL